MPQGGARDGGASRQGKGGGLEAQSMLRGGDGARP